jgi:2-C-methyl-D-erythritol 4-phosphate cytidylyltransferase
MPIVFHTLKRFEECDSIHEVIVVLPATESANFLSLTERFGLRKLAKVVPGGPTRADSVKRGLMSIRSATAEIVAVHDGVRPFVTVEEIRETIVAAERHGAAILVAPVTDTIKEVTDQAVVCTVNRERLRRALTPQCFRYDLLRKAYENVDVTDASLTDECSLVEKLGERVVVIEGNARNIKITTQADLTMAESIMREGLWS